MLLFVIAIIPTRLLGEPFLRLKPCSDPHGHGKQMLKKKIRKKGRFISKFRAYLCLIWVLFAPLGELISLMESSFPSTVFCIFGCIFHFDVVLDSEIWGLWSNETFRNFKRMTRKADKMRISCDSVSNIHWRSKHVKCNSILNVLDTTDGHDFLRIREAHYGQYNFVRAFYCFIKVSLQSLHDHDVKMPITSRLLRT